MAAEIPIRPSASGKASAAQMQQLENALNNMGVTRSHKSIIFLVVCGVLFDVFEQNAVGLAGPLLRQQWGWMPPISPSSTPSLFAAAMGRLLSGYLADRMGRRFMLNVNLGLFTLGQSPARWHPITHFWRWRVPLWVLAWAERSPRR